MNIRPLEEWPIGTLHFSPHAVLAYSILGIYPFFSELLDRVAVGGLLETVLMAVFFEQHCYAVALELENVPFAHYQGWIWDYGRFGGLVVCRYWTFEVEVDLVWRKFEFAIRG